MGTAGELQYVLPILMVAVAINYCIVNLEMKKLNYIGYIIIFTYIPIKILVYKLFNYNNDIINTFIIAFILINISFIFRDKIWKKTKDIKQIIFCLNTGRVYGGIMLLIIFYIIWNKRMYINKYNLIIMCIEYIFVGISYILGSKYIIRQIYKNLSSE